MNTHRAFPKPTRRLDEKRIARAVAALAWRRCCAIVDARDHFHCRVCGRRVVRTLTLCAERLEHHHLAPRSIAREIQHDPRNVLTVCSACHGQLTRRELIPFGTVDQTFTVESTRYLNADAALTFVRP